MTPIPFLARPYSPAWFTEAEAQLQAIAAEVPCTAELLDTTPSVEIAPWDVIPDAWQIEAEALAAEDADWYATRESDYPR